MAKFENLVELFERAVKLYGPKELFGTKKNGQWVWSTYADVGRQVDRCRGGLASLGVKRGDRVAMISNNRVEWAVTAYACYGLGAAFVPMYEAQLAKEWAFIINDCEAVALITSTDAIYQKCKELPEKVPSLKHLIGVSLPKDDPMSYQALLEAGAKTEAPPIHPDPKDTACLIYTSGTTGNPKGVILSHGNIASNITAVHELRMLSGEDRSLSFLPWAHSFGHTCELHSLLSLGGSMALAESVEKIVANLAEVHPTLLVSVPRIFNRIYEGVNKQMADKPALVRNLFHAGLRIASRRRRGEALSLRDKVTLGLADRLVFAKIRSRFGGRLKFASCGGAALSREVAEFMDTLGIVIYEGYGLTETSPIVASNCPGARRIGTVGKPISGVKVVIDKTETHDPLQGEIVIYGPNVMMGYHHRDEENKAVFTDDGGLRTGDLGQLDDDGFLRITGRIKEQYKLENGKYVTPSPLEERLKLSPYILNAMVYGDNRLFNVALVIPDMAAVKGWAEKEGLSPGTPEQLLENPRVKALIQSEVDKCSADWKGFERVRKITLSAEDFTMENGMLTPTLKLKRRVAWERYQKQIESLYEGETEGQEKPRSATAAAS